MDNLHTAITAMNLASTRDKQTIIDEIISACEAFGCTVVETVVDKPWGAMVRLDTKDADSFIKLFFPKLTPDEARLGKSGVELSPKFLLVSPKQRLSWQLHHRRAECWSYITDGAYYKSTDPENMGEMIHAKPSDIVQMKQGECHRLVGDNGDNYTLVAEIWQHTDPEHPSDEDDTVRLQDDYKR